MSAANLKQQTGKQPDMEVSSDAEKVPQLKGAFVCVMLLGAFLVATWVIVFIIFMSRW